MSHFETDADSSAEVHTGTDISEVGAEEQNLVTSALDIKKADTARGAHGTLTVDRFQQVTEGYGDEWYHMHGQGD